MESSNLTSINEKKKVALLSVFAAIFITTFKLIIGLLTGSIGILSEALHSALDFLAAALTFFAISISNRPADKDHHFGHGKIENFLALIETLFLLIICILIIYEATHRILTGKVMIEVNTWSYVVIITSIIIDYTCSRALLKVAKKHNSQALEADSLHFSTDIWSSTVVLIGLISANFGYYYADSIAALFVAFIFITVSYRLGKRSVDVLMDKTPEDIMGKIDEILKSIPEVISYHSVKIRTSGVNIFVEMNIHVDPGLSIEKAHLISHKVQSDLRKKIKGCIAHIYEEPAIRKNK